MTSYYSYILTLIVIDLSSADSVCSSRFYVHDAEDKQTVTPLYEAWFNWQTDKYRMGESIKA